MFALALLLAVQAWPTMAQQSGGKASEPGQIQKRIVTPEAPSGPVKVLTVPEPAPRPDAAPDAKFILVGVEISGATVYRPVEFAFAYEDLLTQEISLREVENILAAITKKYRDDGYILSRAIALPQDVGLGILRIQIIEGFVERVEFTGAKPGGKALLKAFGGKIRANRPLQLEALERYLLLMADAPGLRVFPTLKTLDEDRGAYELQIRLGHTATDGFVNLDNRGTTPVGPLQAFAGINVNSALGLLERARISLFTIPNAPEELLYGQLHYEQILSAEGTRAWFEVSRSVVDTGDAGFTNKNNSRGTAVTLGLSHPVIRSRGTNLFVTLKLETIDSDKKSGTAGEDFDDHLRVARLGGRLSFKDSFGGTNWLDVEVSKGFDILHATDRGASLVSRAGGRSDFFKMWFNVTRRQALMNNLSLEFAASGQKSPHVLLSSEEFSVGGSRFGRVYNPSEISGGDGAAGSLELQFNLPVKPKYMRSIQFYGFYDIGAVWGEGVSHESSLASGGGG